MELISIIMAAYNAEQTIEKAILSVVTQTYQNWELLVIDDCSRDNTLEMAREYAKRDPRIRILHNEVNQGVSCTRKRGLNEARGQWIAILDSDDAWKENKLQQQLLCAHREKVDLVYSGSAFMDKDGKMFDWILHVPKTLTYRDLLKQNLMSNSSIIVKKELYSQFFSSGDGMHEDYAIWLQLLKAGHSVYGIDEPLLIYRLNSSSKTSNKIRSAKMQWNTYMYINLPVLPSIYYMCCYAIRGIRKYRNLQTHSLSRVRL